MRYLFFLVIFFSSVIINCSPSARYASNRNTNSGDAQTELYEGNVFYGEATFYAEKFHGKQTANGEIFDMYKISAAHKTLPFNTLLQVTNLENQKSVIVRVNDRGPYKKGRILDLSYRAAQEISMISSGVIRVKVKIIKMGTS